MSHEREQRDCTWYRERAFDYRREELGELHGEVSAHLEECTDCREYFARVEILLDAAREAEPVEERRDPEAMFEDIEAAIREGEQNRSEAAPGGAGPSSEEPTGGGDDPTPGPRRWWYGAAAAAVAAGLVLGLYVFREPPPEETGRSGPHLAAASDAGGGDDRRRNDEAGEVARDGGRADAASSGPPRLRRVEIDESPDGADDPASGDEDSVRVFASPTSVWEIRDGETPAIELERGDLLVEFLPDGRRSLRVRAPGLDIRVDGTVFYVSAGSERTSRAGVLAGEVEVQSEGRTLRLHSDQEVTPSFERRPVPASKRRAFSAYVDLERHARRIERRDANSDPPSRSPSGNATEKEDAATTNGSPLEQLRERAERAARRSDYERAARLYRRFLDTAPRDHSGVPAVHLDLSNLYIHRLDRRADAVGLLRSFVRRWPDDVAAPSARDELCRLTREIDRFDAECPLDR